jgi:hypothetical protein
MRTHYCKKYQTYINTFEIILINLNTFVFLMIYYVHCKCWYCAIFLFVSNNILLRYVGLMSPVSLDWIVYSWLLLRLVSNNILLRFVGLMSPVSLDWIVYSWLLLRFVSNNILLRSVGLMSPVSLD